MKVLNILMLITLCISGCGTYEGPYPPDDYYYDNSGYYPSGEYYTGGIDPYIVAEAVRYAQKQYGCSARVIDLRRYPPTNSYNRETVIVTMEVCNVIRVFRLLGCTGYSCFFQQDRL